MFEIFKKLFAKKQLVVTKFPGVVVGLIQEVTAHPNADRLRLTKVDVGGNVLKIVCGAPNIEVGQLVPVATIGAILPNGMELKPAVIRGESSEGMLCATDELGLGTDHSGILILPTNAKVGDNIDNYLNM